MAGSNHDMMVNQTRHRSRVILVSAFGMAVAFVEAAVVVYLRELFYPEGFSFPLRTIPHDILAVELCRELTTIVILVTIGGIAGRKLWERFGYFLFLFGIWDIFYYVWLKVTIKWPTSLFEWDILFLIPVPWIGPVIAPVLISVLMIITGLSIIDLFTRGYGFKPSLPAWILALVGTAAILFSFMRDTAATLNHQMPQPYLYSLLDAGLLLCAAGFLLSYRRAVVTSSE